MLRKVSETPSGSHFIYLPKQWYEAQIGTGWNGKVVKITDTSKLIIEPNHSVSHSFITSKVPLRLPLGGGGTDLPEYYTKQGGGLWISGSINNYVYVLIKNRFEEQSKFVYSETQYVDDPSQFTHPILRAVMTKYDVIKHIELISLADLPARIGLGSSGSFTVALLNAIHTLLNKESTKQELAEEAYEVERLMLGRNIGKQDQYVATYGGVRIYTIDEDGLIESSIISHKKLEKWLLLFYINQRKIPAWKAVASMPNMDRKKILAIGTKSAKAIQDSDFWEYGKLIEQHWSIKRKYQPELFDGVISKAKWKGAIGGKLCGAGAGGCILLVCPPEDQLSVIETMKEMGVVHIPFKFDPFGAEVYQ